ncbi:hypothetical protein [Xanthobacter autotrophicus]|uniref:hypothetical protein n=1 Tax=Xanthobacter autotrophicus TaxID=280 RepID=UPI0037283D69
MEIKAQFSQDGDPIAFYNTDLHPSDIIPSDAVTITESEWVDFLIHQGERRWVDERVVQYSPPPATPTIPDQVTRTQALLALLAMPTPITEAEILAAIDQIPDLIERERARILFNHPLWKRADPFIAQIGAAFGLDGPAIDTLFQQAALI